VAAGTAAALQSTVEQAVKDSYAALKGHIQRKYAQVNLDQLEANLSSKSRRADVPGFHLHPLTGNLAGFWSVTIHANWRIIFRFDEHGDATDVDDVDYH